MLDLLTPKRVKILAIILCMVLIIGLVCCSGPKTQTPTETEPPTTPTESIPDEPDPIIDSETIPPTEPVQIEVNMGTVTAGELNIRKGADSGYEKVGTYLKGDRIEILETKNVDGTVWGRTNLGWIGMGYVKMDGTAPAADAPKIVSDGNTSVLGYGVINLGELNVRMGPGTNHAKIATVKISNRYAYYQLEDGWARIEDGWVSTDYFYVEGTTTDGACPCIVTTENLNIRSGPNTSFKTVGTYQKGETVTVLVQVDAWGYTEKGWVFITYLEPIEPTFSTGTGKVNTGLNIRKEPNSEAEIVGSYVEGETVTIIEVNGSWGKTDKGWINLNYVSFG